MSKEPQKEVHESGRSQELKRFSAIFLDQPWSRQFALIHRAMPHRKRVGILLGRESAELGPSLVAAAKDNELVTRIETVTDDADLLPSLKRLLASSDTLLAVPDASIYNRANIASILLSSYHAEVPMIGFSASYVKAGALVSLYSQPSQIAQQVAEIVQSMSSGGALPAPQSPRYFSISVNPQVKRSLEVKMDEDTELLSKLKQLPEVGQ